MAHLVETAAYSDKPAWHGVGTVVEGAISIAEVVKVAGIDWAVELSPLYHKVDGHFVEMSPKRFAIRRETDKRVYGSVGAGYRPIQNAEAASFLDELMASGDLKVEAAGSLEFGRRVWILARIPDEIIIAGDKTYPYLLYTNAHDGLKACNVFPTAVRVVCNNTERAAFWSRDRSLTVHIPHVGDIDGKIATARRVLGLSLDIFKAYGSVMSELAAEDGLPLVQPFLAQLFPPKFDEVGKELENRQREEKLAEVTAMFNREPGQTAFGLLNAVTAWVDHVNLPATSHDNVAGSKAERLMASALTGRGADTKAEAANILLSMTGIYERQRAALDELKVRVKKVSQAA